MRRILLSILLVGSLAGCASPLSEESPTPLPTGPIVTKTPAFFDIQTPIVFADYSFQLEPHVYKTLILECISGTYSSNREDWNRAWSGTFRFRLADGPSVSLTDGEDIISCEIELSFNAPFELYVSDFNSDGQPDFALTQFGSYSGGDYGKIYTLQDDGTVAELPVKGDKRNISEFGLIDIVEEDTNCFLIPCRHTPGSIDLEQVENGFLVRTEDPFSYISPGGIYFMGRSPLDGQIPTALEDIYLWDGTAFVLSEQRLIYEEG